MGAIRTNAAAAMLGVSPNTLRSWERRFGYPEPSRTAGGHRQFDLNEIEALRSAFEETHNISSAVALARERGAGPATPSRLRSAFARFDEVDADRVLEESLPCARSSAPSRRSSCPAWRASTPTARGPTPSTASRGAGPRARWPPLPAWRPRRRARTASSSSMPARRATWTLCTPRRSSCACAAVACAHLTLTMALDPSRLSRALHALEPRAVVLTGRRASLDALGRLVYAARRVGGARRHRLRLPRGAAHDGPHHGAAPGRERAGRRRAARRGLPHAALRRPRAHAARGRRRGLTLPFVPGELRRAGGADRHPPSASSRSAPSTTRPTTRRGARASPTSAPPPASSATIGRPPRACRSRRTAPTSSATRATSPSAPASPTPSWRPRPTTCWAASTSTPRATRATTPMCARWVRADVAELDPELHAASAAWLADAWPFAAVDYADRG